MRAAWQVIDTGLRPAAENIAFNRALLEARCADEIPDTLRFLRFEPSALLGYHQSAAQELALDYCQNHGIAVQRRITGGGAIYFDEHQLGWELYLHRQTVGVADMQTVARRICEAAAMGIRALGVDARFRPRNDIEVNGRKISGSGGAFDGDILMYQGTLLLRFDVEHMLRVLRIPAEKLQGKAIASARERVASLAALLGDAPPLARAMASLRDAFRREFDADMRCMDPSADVMARFAVALRAIDHPDWINLYSRPAADAPLLEGVGRFPGGLLRVGIAYDRRARRIKQIAFSGDFFVSPARTIADLETVLRNVAQARLRTAILSFFDAHPVDMLGLTPENFAAVAQRALASADAPLETSNG